MDTTLVVALVQLVLLLVMAGAYVGALGVAWRVGVSKAGLALGFLVACIPIVHLGALVLARLAVRQREDALERGEPSDAAIQIAGQARLMNSFVLVFAIAMLLNGAVAVGVMWIRQNAARAHHAAPFD